jgi:predicted glycoside hydrolase/deacetylase ChbG (UPF0249 family)
MKQIKECSLEVEAFEDNDSLGKNRRKAFVKAYLPFTDDSDIEQVLSEKCEFMGFKLIKIVEIKNVTETDIPDEAVDNYHRFKAGFGKFHSFP